MPQQASIYRVLVASPGDCTHERLLIPKIVASWNASHSVDESAIIECVEWETHSHPSLGARPQEVINKQIVEGCDFVIGTFWTKLGTPTTVAKSGSVEEIDFFKNANKPVLLYFSSEKIRLEDVNLEQYKALLEYKKSIQDQGLYAEYDSLQDLQEKLSRHLAATMIELLRGVAEQKVELPKIQPPIVSPEPPKSGTETPDGKELPTLPYGDSISLFSHRVSKAFPGVRGVEWFNNAEIATERLMLLLREPLIFKPRNPEFGGNHSPIWWFRAGSSMMIEKVERLSPTKILMDGEELSIKRIAVSESPRWYLCFVYVEAQAEAQTGLYNYSADDIEDQRKVLGYANEEYGLFEGQLIKRTEYDDGAAVINNKVVEVHGAELRTRYLTDYNFIICAQEAVFNSSKFDAGSEEFMDGILNGTSTTEGFFNWMNAFKKNDNRD